MMEVFKGSSLNEIIEEMLAHMKTQVENLALANSRFVSCSWISISIS